MKGNINVNEIAEGEVREKINKAIEEQLDNIRKLNTSPFDKRKENEYNEYFKKLWGEIENANE